VKVIAKLNVETTKKSLAFTCHLLLI